MKNFFLFFIILIFVIGFFSRSSTLVSHFTHIDDIGVAKTILNAKISAAQGNTVIENIYNPEHENYNLSYKKEIRKYLDKDKHSFFLNIIKIIYPYFAIPFFWSYAPIQFIFTTPLLTFAENYEQVKFFGRLPSLIFSLISFPFFFIITRTLFNDRNYYLSLVAASLFFLSWEYLIISQLMHNKAFGVLSFLIIIYFLLKLNTLNQKRYVTNGFKIGILLSFFVYADYQILMIIPAFLATMVWNLLEFKRLNDKINSLKFIFFSSFFTFILTLPAVFWISIKHLGVLKNSWNSGPIVGELSSGEYFSNYWSKDYINFRNSETSFGEYFFNWNSFHESYLYLPTFFIKNFYILVSRMLSFVSESFFHYETIFIIIYILIPIGLISFLLSKNFNNRIIGRFATSLFIVWIVFVLLSKITLSPTRHSVILLPILCLLTVKGFEFILLLLSKKIFKKEIITISSIITSITIIFLFLYNYKDVMKYRSDLFKEDRFVNLLESYNVTDILLYDGNLPIPFLMPKLAKNNVNIYFMNSPEWPQFKEDNSFVMNDNIKNISFVSYMYPIDKSEIAQKFVSNHLNNWEIVYSDEKELPVELEFSKLTNNFGNNFYLYIYSK